MTKGLHPVCGSITDAWPLMNSINLTAAQQWSIMSLDISQLTTQTACNNLAMTQWHITVNSNTTLALSHHGFSNACMHTGANIIQDNTSRITTTRTFDVSLTGQFFSELLQVLNGLEKWSFDYCWRTVLAGCPACSAINSCTAVLLEEETK